MSEGLCLNCLHSIYADLNLLRVVIRTFHEAHAEGVLLPAEKKRAYDISQPAGCHSPFFCLLKGQI